MNATRMMLIVVSASVILVLAGGGLALRVGASDGSYREAVLFSQVLSLIMDNYVDPVDSEILLDGAFEEMMRTLDPNGAYLAPDEVREWKRDTDEHTSDPGVSVIKVRGSVHVVRVVPGSPAADASISRGDQIRAIDLRPVRDLSLEQVRRLLRGKPATTVRLELLRVKTGFEREDVELTRVERTVRSYQLDVVDDTGVLVVRSLAPFPADDLAEELGALRSRGIDRLMLDLRDVVEGSPRDAVAIAGQFAKGSLFRLRDPSGQVIESVDGKKGAPSWSDALGVLVNGATAGGAEGVAKLVQAKGLGRIYGEKSYGLGSEAALFELPDGAGLLLPVAVWEVADGEGWNEVGVEPDTVVRGGGSEAESDEQLERALKSFESDLQTSETGERKAA